MTPPPLLLHDTTPNRRPQLVAVSWARTVPVELLALSLSADDHARLGGRRRGGDRDRSASARVLLRAAVGAWTGAPADAVVIRTACAL